MTTCDRCHLPNGAHTPTCAVLDEALAAPPMTVNTTIDLIDHRTARVLTRSPLSELTSTALTLVEGMDHSKASRRARIVLWFLTRRMRRLHRKILKSETGAS